MVNYSSVDWLAQSCHGRARGADARVPRRPHVPCVVQPAPPTLGKSHLQTKPTKLTQHPRQWEAGRDRGSCASSPSCASPVSKTSDYSSGDESKPASPPSDAPTETVVVHGRRGRTKFSKEQVAKLEKIFHKYKYVDLVRRVKTAKKLGLKETQVRTWFQNRRMRMKRALQEGMDSEVPRGPIRDLVPVPLVTRPYAPTHRMLYCHQMWPQLLQFPQLFYKPAP